MQKENKLNLKVFGRLALFSDPVTRVGGEKCSYQIPTYQALKGIFESCYWKPSFIWVIDRVRVMKQIKTQSKGIRPIKYGGGNDLSIYTYLSDVEYQVEAHIEWNENRPDLENDWNENKHYFIAKRMIEKGGRRDIFLGTRECQAYVEYCSFGEGDGFYDNLSEMSFGLMYHGMTYPDENQENELRVRFWLPKMKNGIIEFCKPTECNFSRIIKKNAPKGFSYGTNFEDCNVLAREEGYE
ncbi:MAG: type I-C CRISPR-associated protein Cas5 [Clostridiales bacterium GWF2_38_85]|nr:MAG: type I-C CRISPR-associated protein Cas5 [Clostridiales bacterium GWF2_38_85]HBL84977.1 type I-C CRISPR-associated protein Cas5 [Clostridiales bacterium]